jgi:hypothetical protein
MVKAGHHGGEMPDEAALHCPFAGLYVLNCVF